MKYTWFKKIAVIVLACLPQLGFASQQDSELGSSMDSIVVYGTEEQPIVPKRTPLQQFCTETRAFFTHRQDEQHEQERKILAATHCPVKQDSCVYSLQHQQFCQAVSGFFAEERDLIARVEQERNEQLEREARERAVRELAAQREREAAKKKLQELAKARLLAAQQKEQARRERVKRERQKAEARAIQQERDARWRKAVAGFEQAAREERLRREREQKEAAARAAQAQAEAEREQLEKAEILVEKAKEDERAALAKALERRRQKRTKTRLKKAQKKADSELEAFLVEAAAENARLAAITPEVVYVSASRSLLARVARKEDTSRSNLAFAACVLRSDAEDQKGGQRNTALFGPSNFQVNKAQCSGRVIAHYAPEPMACSDRFVSYPNWVLQFSKNTSDIYQTDALCDIEIGRSQDEAVGQEIFFNNPGRGMTLLYNEDNVKEIGDEGNRVQLYIYLPDKKSVHKVTGLELQIKRK